MRPRGAPKPRVQALRGGGKTQPRPRPARHFKSLPADRPWRLWWLAPLRVHSFTSSLAPPGVLRPSAATGQDAGGGGPDQGPAGRARREDSLARVRHYKSHMSLAWAVQGEQQTESPFASPCLSFPAVAPMCICPTLRIQAPRLLFPPSPRQEPCRPAAAGGCGRPLEGGGGKGPGLRSLGKHRPACLSLHISPPTPPPALTFRTSLQGGPRQRHSYRCTHPCPAMLLLGMSSKSAQHEVLHRANEVTLVPWKQQKQPQETSRSFENWNGAGLAQPLSQLGSLPH